MLYDVIDINPDDVAGMFEVPSGNVANIQLNLPAGAYILIKLAQIGYAQDYSLRAWISVYSDGVPIEPEYNREFALNRQIESFVLYDRLATNLVLPSDLRNVPALPGSYILNILNIVNSINAFSFSQSVVTSKP